METRFTLSATKTAIKNGYCMIIDSHGYMQFWSKVYWRDFLPEV